VLLLVMPLWLPAVRPTPRDPWLLLLLLLEAPCCLLHVMLQGVRWQQSHVVWVISQHEAIQL
jgi:hypothetical protein